MSAKLFAIELFKISSKSIPVLDDRLFVHCPLTQSALENMLTQRNSSYSGTGRAEQWLIRQKLNMHHVWWAIVSVVNLGLLITLQNAESLPYFSGAFSVGNLLLSTLIRNELILHGLYRLAVAVSKRITLGKYYTNASVHYIGGVHVACAAWGVVWLLINILHHLNHWNHPILAVTSWTLLILLLIITLTSTPSFRHRFHNIFEKIHRYGGWTCLAILVLHVVSLQSSIDSNSEYSLNTALSNSMILMTALIIVSVFLPWITIQRFDRFTVHCPSLGVLVLSIPGRADIGTFARISTDLVEWHSFSVARMYFDQQTGESKIQLIIATAGDWTKSIIDRVYQGNVPKQIWVRRVKPPGFMFSINAYSRVLVIATGAGIAPVLPYVAKNGDKLRLLWIGNDHQATYGEEIWSMITAHPHLKIYDTGVHGRPDAGQLTLQTVKEFRPQAVFCVSNKAVTQAVVQACLAKGIPAYGATWDS